MIVNYVIMGTFTVGILVLVVFLIIKNQRDRKKMEQQMNRPQTPPKKHPEGEGSI